MKAIGTATVFLVIARISFRTRLKYKSILWTTAAAQAVELFIVSAIWNGVYATRDTLVGMDSTMAVSYALSARLLLGLTATGLISQLGRQIRSGDLLADLLKPVDFQLYSASFAVGQIFTAIMAGLPLVPLAVALGLRPTLDPILSALALVIVCLGLANILLFDWILSCITFFTSYAWGVAMLYSAVIRFFSGAILPLALMPAPLRFIATLLPHSQVVAIPAELVSGMLDSQEAWKIVGLQMLTLPLLFLSSRLVFRSAFKYNTAQGG